MVCCLGTSHTARLGTVNMWVCMVFFLCLFFYVFEQHEMGTLAVGLILSIWIGEFNLRGPSETGTASTYYGHGCSTDTGGGDSVVVLLCVIGVLLNIMTHHVGVINWPPSNICHNYCCCSFYITLAFVVALFALYLLRCELLLHAREGPLS
jgi:hypothetical protein